MRDNRFSSSASDPVGSSRSNPAATALALEDDVHLLALETQFNGLIKELMAAQKANEESDIYDSDREAGTNHMEAILARLQPIERAIMQAPVCTVTGLGVKARHAAYVMSQYWGAPTNQIDWDEQVVRLLIEAICKLANVPLPSFETVTEASP
jgi:hypothetical protein